MDSFEIKEIVEIYISNYLMPKDDLGDGRRIATRRHFRPDHG